MDNIDNTAARIRKKRLPSNTYATAARIRTIRREIEYEQYFIPSNMYNMAALAYWQYSIPSNTHKTAPLECWQYGISSNTDNTAALEYGQYGCSRIHTIRLLSNTVNTTALQYGCSRIRTIWRPSNTDNTAALEYGQYCCSRIWAIQLLSNTGNTAALQCTFLTQLTLERELVTLGYTLGRLQWCVCSIITLIMSYRFV